MRAQKYFPENVLINIEEALMDDCTTSVKFKYCLIDDASGSYYLGETIAIVGIYQRLRSIIVNKADYRVMAHNVQQLVLTSNMSSWAVAVFQEHITEAYIHEVMKQVGYNQLHRETPYGVNDVSNIRIYTAKHVRNNLCVKYATVNSNPSAAYDYVRRNLRALQLDGDLEKKINQIADHTYSKEWVVISEEKPKVFDRHEIRKQVLKDSLVLVNRWAEKKSQSK